VKNDLVNSKESYSKPIDIVLSIKGVDNNPELFLIYLKAKDIKLILK
jgi:hypothetical protein